MSKKLADKLRIGIELEHKSYSTVANGNKMLKYGYTQKIVTIKKMNIPINFNISDSTSTDVLLDTSFFVATNTKIDYGKRKIKLYYGNKKCSINFYVEH